MRLLAILIILVASSAAAQSPAGDGCRDQGGPEPLCKSAEAASNSAAWMCRHAGGPEDQCSALDGRAIASEDVDAYMETATHAAFVELRLREDGLPLQETFWFSTHNSFNSAWYDPTFTSQDPNHVHSIHDQLRMDARGLEIDIHWLPQPDHGGFAPMVCHGRGADEGHGGCTADRHLAAVLPEIRAWLDANPEEVILIDIQDELQHQAGDEVEAHEAAAAVFVDVFEEMLLRPSDHNGTCDDGVPVHLSRDAIRALGRRVVVISDCAVGEAWPAMIHGKSNWVQQSAPLEDCVWDAATYATAWTRIWGDSTFVGEGAETVGAAGEVEPIRTQDVPMLVACGLNMISVDQLVPDERLDAFASAWLERRPVPQPLPEPEAEPMPAPACEPNGTCDEPVTASPAQESPTGVAWLAVLAAVAVRRR